jgi:ArsR family transcriptional regulator, arsenate/arsenite/antimonite-responsive transcriptional repressor
MLPLEAVAALAALAHEHRLAIFRLLVEAGPGGLTAGTISTRLRMAPSTLTFHLQHLQHAQLIRQRRDGRQLIYSADFEEMNSLVGYLTENCCAHSGEACSATVTVNVPRKGMMAARGSRGRSS